MTTRKLSIAMVGYYNTIPFLRELERAPQYDLTLDIPARCIDYFKNNEVDVALVPVGSLVDLDKNAYKIITDYCIGCKGEVRTVCLFSNNPIDDVHTIYLDNHSRTSVELVKLLVDRYWKQEVDYKSITEKGPELIPGEAVVLIGDKVFAVENDYAFKYDLGEAWYDLYQLPFAFAVWIARPDLLSEDSASVNDTLKLAVANIENVKDWGVEHLEVDFQEYFERYIDYTLDSGKKESIKIFLDYLDY